MGVTVAVVGGGYGGITAARLLDPVADVILVEPRDTFVHNVAALRGAVDASWTECFFLPYDRLLRRGRIVRDRAASVASTTVELGSGGRIAADYVVLATGSRYPFPAKMDVEDSRAAQAKLHATRESLATAERVLLLGAGPVGLEFAGEILAAWPGKSVTLVDPATELPPAGFPGEFTAELRRQLDALGVRLLLGTSLAEDPPGEPGASKTFTVSTHAGGTIEADIWFRCFGTSPSTEYLAGGLAAARGQGGELAVTPELRVPGHDRVFAIGDVTALPEAKTARAAADHAEVAAANIRTLIEGGTALRTYTPPAPAIALPLGPKGGLTYSPEAGLLGAEQTAEIKGRDMMIARFGDVLGLDEDAS